MGKVVEIVKDEWSAKIPEYLKIEPYQTYFGGWHDYDLLKRIPKNFLVGTHIRVDHYGTNGLIIVRYNPYVELMITSWTGISMGAVHYYGRLKIHGIDIGDEENPTTTHGGFLGAKDEELPLAFRVAQGLEFTITRPIEQRDLEHDDRFESYHLGEPTRGFWKEEDAIEKGKKIAAKYFTDWKLEIDV